MTRSLALLLGLALAVPGGATAARHRTVQPVDATVVAAVVARHGDKIDVAGTIVDKHLGRGAFLYVIRRSAAKTGFTALWANGSLHGSATGFAVLPEDSGASTVTGKGGVSGGSGRFRHAHGKLSFTGRVDTRDRIRLHLLGSVSY